MRWDVIDPRDLAQAGTHTVDGVLANGQKITAGVSATEFGPDVNCTRAQIVTFLYRALNK